MRRRRARSLVAALALGVVALAPVLPASGRALRAARPPANSPVILDDPSIVPRGALLTQKAKPRFGVAQMAAARPGGPLRPVEVREFNAIPRLLDVTPGDPTGARGRSHIVTAVNVHYAVWDPDGTALVGPSHLGSLFDVPDGTRIFDPKVVYDPGAGRYFLSAAGLNSGSRDSYLLIASFSDLEATTPAVWCRRELAGDPVPGRGNLVADYPALGFDDSHLYISSNQFTFRGGFRYAQVLAIDRDDLGTACTGGATVSTEWGLRDPDGSLAFTVQPAVSIGNGASPNAWGLSFDWDCFPCRGSRLTLWRFGTNGGDVVARVRSLRVGRTRIAPLGAQRGGRGIDALWDTGDLRLVTAFYDNVRKRLYGGHAVRHDLGGSSYIESAVRWYEVATRRTFRDSHLRRKGTVGRARTDAGWPAIATDVDGRVAITYSRAAPDEFLSAWLATLGPTGTRPHPLILRRGTGRYEATSPTPGLPGVERWGDYNAITRDPLVGTRLWTVNQYAKNDGNPANGVRTRLWQQVVHAVHG